MTQTFPISLDDEMSRRLNQLAASYETTPADYLAQLVVRRLRSAMTREELAEAERRHRESYEQCSETPEEMAADDFSAWRRD